MSFDPRSLSDGDPSSLPSFDEPWQARAFAIAVALTDPDEDGTYDWSSFNAEFVAELDAIEPLTDDIENMYFAEWVDAIESLLLADGVISETEYEQRTSEFKTGDRDASEFVEGDPHGHTSGTDHASGS